MTKEILNMSKEELINNIAKTEEYGRNLENMISEMSNEHAELMEASDKLIEQMNRCIGIMETMALANASMRKLLKDEYGSFVM